MKLADGTEVTVRTCQEEDVEAIVRLIARNFREVNVKDYGAEAMEELVASHDVNWFKGVAEYANVYVFWRKDKIVGVGSISSFWGSLTESILLTIFVLPELHHQGIGSFIIDTLEADELFLRADRIEIPASITAVEFYRKKGYDYKNGVKELDDEKHYRLEKFRKKVTLQRAGTEDAERLHEMQKKAFQELLDKYQDYETNPASEAAEKVFMRLKQEFTY
ncbi:MAG: GNAT family N-acetyltransferase [Lachnospiraceae bacterium]|nr:GNAT family N-acetyltransferase [Lachnospiraceae bacterium]